MKNLSLLGTFLLCTILLSACDTASPSGVDEPLVQDEVIEDADDASSFAEASEDKEDADDANGDLVTRNVTFSGIVEEGGLSMFQEGTHRLTLSDGRIVLLESVDDAHPLQLYVGKLSRLTGDVMPTDEGVGTLMKVHRVVFLRREQATDGSMQEVERVLCSEDGTAPCASGMSCIPEGALHICAASDAGSESSAPAVSADCPAEYVCAEVRCELPQVSHCIQTSGCSSCCTCREEDKQVVEPDNECVVGGCSGQLCVRKGEEIASTCEWRDEYACYKSAVCELQQNGSCGWTATPEFQSCMVHEGEDASDRSDGASSSSEGASSSSASSVDAKDVPTADLSGLDPARRELIESMVTDDYSADRWTQVYCSPHAKICINQHKNWWYKSFGATSSVLWHFEAGAAPVEEFGDGPIIVALKTGSLASLGVSDGSVKVIGSKVIGYREWTNNSHFEISASSALHEPVAYMTKSIRALEE